MCEIEKAEFEAMVRRQEASEQALKEVREDIRQIRADTSGIVDFFDSATGAFKVLNWIGKAAKPLGYIAATIAAVAGAWASVKGGIK